MKFFLLLLFVGALVAMYYFHNKQAYDASKSAPVQYTKSLQNDEKRAEEAAQKATANMVNMNQQLQKGAQQENAQPEGGQ